MYESAYRRKRTVALILTIFGLLTCVLAIGSLIARGSLRNRLYRQKIAISPASDIATRLGNYESAISIFPGRTEAYLLLLDAYAEDGIFTKSESESFLSLYNRNAVELEKADGFGQLNEKAALLYINGYDGESTVTNLRMAIPLLNVARAAEKEPSDVLTAYGKIGDYYSTYIWDASAVRDVSQEEMSKLLQEILDMLPDVSELSAFDRLGFYRAVCNLIYDQREIIAATCPRSLPEGLLDAVYNSLPDYDSLQKEATKNVLESLLAAEDTYREMLSRAYERRQER